MTGFDADLSTALFATKTGKLNKVFTVNSEGFGAKRVTHQESVGEVSYREGCA